MTVEEWRQAAQRVSNWGRWGDRDELGTLNFVGTRQLLSAVEAVKRGQAYSLSDEINSRGVNGSSGFRRNPLHLMVVDGQDAALAYVDELPGAPEQSVASMQKGDFKFAEDMIIMSLQSGTQWDGLAHVYYDGLMYNGYSANSITSLGASRCGIHMPANRGVLGRGILIDVARSFGVDYLPERFAVTPEVLDDVLAEQGCVVASGDFILLRTGWLGKLHSDGNKGSYISEYAGLSWECAEWAHSHEVAAIAADNFGVEVNTGEFRLHMLAIRDMGMLLGEMWRLDELASAANADGAYESLLVAAPLPITSAVASPVNPIALR